MNVEGDDFVENTARAVEMSATNVLLNMQQNKKTSYLSNTSHLFTHLESNCDPLEHRII